MQKKQWQTALKNLPLGQQHYFAQVGSTNDIAAKLLDADAPHLSLVLADEQVKGRGRNGRSWTTTGGAALAFSVILLPKDDLGVPTGYKALSWELGLMFCQRQFHPPGI
ncbi:MAG: hypothetical protein B5M51_07335 [Anaerolinea sp. 4484_236]|nr:MAG: hypothetical protein B5M51_07335 [Anaerolinea sp. 4484_236]